MFRDAPQYVTALVQRFEADRVYSAGLAILGFPPTWEISYDDCRAIAAHLNKEN